MLSVTVGSVPRHPEQMRMVAVMEYDTARYWAGGRPIFRVEYRFKDPYDIIFLLVLIG